MINPLVNQLLAQYPIISDQISREELRVVLRELCRTLDRSTEGDIVEFGCYIGTTSLFVRRVLDAYKRSGQRSFHVYDSFEGLPPKVDADKNAAGVDFAAGELRVSKKQLLHEFQRAKLMPPIAHKGWFNELSGPDVPHQIVFAFLDGDFYDSILSSLRLVWPRMHEQGIIAIHDYKRETLPGVERAVRDFFHDKPSITLRHEQNIAIIEV